MTQYTSLVSFDWGQGSPGPWMPSDNWTARFTTDAFFNATTYSFTAVADDEVIVTVDGVQYINTVGRNLSGKSIGVTMPMSQGTHRVEVLYREFTVDAYVFVSWSTCSGCTAPPTPGVTYPPLPSNQNPPLVTDFGDYTTCMQTPMHQVNCFVPTWNLDGAPSKWRTRSSPGSSAAQPTCRRRTWSITSPRTISARRRSRDGSPNKSVLS